MVALPPSPTLAPDALPADGELIELQPIAEPPAPTQPVPVAAASITLVDGDRSPPTSLNMSSTSPSSSSSHHSADWTHVKPPPLVSYGSAFSGVSSTSSCSSISNASFSSSDAPIGGLGLSGTGSKQLSSVALDSLLSASSSSARSSGASKAQRRGVSSLGASLAVSFSALRFEEADQRRRLLAALSPMPVPGSAEEDDDDGHITPTSTAASSPAPSRMTTPGLRHKALPPLTGPSQAPNLDEGEPDLPMDDVAQSAKHSRARAGSVGVDGPLGFDGDEEDEGEESDDECGSSGTEASAAYASERGAGLRRRTTIRA